MLGSALGASTGHHKSFAFNLLQIFSELAKIGPVIEGDAEEVSSRSPWFNTEPHPGLRAYPFLSQVGQHLPCMHAKPLSPQKEALFRQSHAL